MKDFKSQFKQFFASESGDLVIQLGIIAVTTTSVTSSIWYLI